MMNTYYKTTNWGGMEGRTVVKRYFDTEENARKWAEADNWGTGYEIYKCTAIADERGMYKITEEKIG